MSKTPRNESEQGLLDYIRHLQQMYEDTPNMLGREEFLKRMAFMREHGRFYTPEPRLRSPLRHMTNGECYRNAALLATESPDTPLHYVEGIACTVIPTGHAWLTDGDNAIDPTWTYRTKTRKYPPLAYFGVELDYKTLVDGLLTTELYTAHKVPPF